MGIEIDNEHYEKLKKIAAFYAATMEDILEEYIEAEYRTLAAVGEIAEDEGKNA